jgi:hypothetical protein
MTLFWGTVEVVLGLFFSGIISILALFLLIWGIDACSAYWEMNSWRVRIRYRDWLRRQQRRYGR